MLFWKYGVNNYVNVAKTQNDYINKKVQNIDIKSKKKWKYHELIVSFSFLKNTYFLILSTKINEKKWQPSRNKHT